MPAAASTKPLMNSRGLARTSGFASRVRSEVPSLPECGAALVSAVLLVISFPDFDLWPLAWIALVPVLLVIVRKPKPVSSFLLGWIFGTVFFYLSCYWLTSSIIHTGGTSPVIAFVLLVPGALLLGAFPAGFTLFLAQVIKRW